MFLLFRCPLFRSPLYLDPPVLINQFVFTLNQMCVKLILNFPEVDNASFLHLPLHC